MLLVADVGGTHTRLALAARRDGRWSLGQLRVVPTTLDVPALVRDYLRDAGRPALEAFAACGAGPLRPDGSIRLTNRECVLAPQALAEAAEARVVVANDFEAVARAIPALEPAELEPCGGGSAVPRAPSVVLGAGTGLGVALLLPAGAGWHVVSGEGGHVDLAPVDDEELAVWTRLRKRRPRVSAETVLCGAGLEALYAALDPAEPLAAARIAEAAWQGEPLARRAVRLFTGWLGRVAGNLVLTAGATGGVYLAGGIVPGWGARFDTALFRAAFEDKAPFIDWMRSVPAFIVKHPQPGLLGLAELAASGR